MPLKKTNKKVKWTWLQAKLLSIGQTKDLLWYLILFLTIYAKRTYGLPILHQAILPMGAQSSTWIASHLAALNLAAQNLNHTSSPVTDIPVTTPNYPDSPAETSAYTMILAAAGSLIVIIAGVTALLHRFFCHRSPSPAQLGYGGQEEEEEGEEAGSGEVWRILKKAPHMRSARERLIVSNWQRQQDPFQM